MNSGVIETPSNNTILQPIFMENKDETKRGQKDEINKIIQNSYNEYRAKIIQPQGEPILPHNIVKKTTVSRVAELVDLGWASWNTLSFVLNTTGMKAYNRYEQNAYPLFSIKKGSPIGSIVFFGSDSYKDINDLLNSYGYLDYTFNALANEQQISWFAYDDMPDKNWIVYVNFCYTRSE